MLRISGCPLPATRLFALPWYRLSFLRLFFRSPICPAQTAYLPAPPTGTLRYRRTACRARSCPALTASLPPFPTYLLPCLPPLRFTSLPVPPQIYFRQEKYDMAAVHFKSAASINPSSSVLHCYIAMTLHRQGLHDRALTKLQVRRGSFVVRT